MAQPSNTSQGQPLFMVDRDWLRKGSKTRKSWTGNVRNHSLYGLAIEATQNEVPGAIPRNRARSLARKRRREKQEETTDSEGQSEQEQSIGHESLTLWQSNNSHTEVGTLQMSRNETRGASFSDPNSRLTLQESFRPSVAKSRHDVGCLRSLECCLDFYLDIFGTPHDPGEDQGNWMPMSIPSPRYGSEYKDDLWVQNITLFSALHNASLRNDSISPATDELMSSFLSQLNDRISRSDLSDGTIATVSCLAHGEHSRGNTHLAKVHAGGMAEMIRLRGGLHSIHYSKRSKIARGDIVRSADTLEVPLLPRLPRESGQNLVVPPAHTMDILRQASGTGVSPHLMNILYTLSSICVTLDSALGAHEKLDNLAYSESILCLSHDLLSFDSRSTLDEIFKISIVNFIQPLYRYSAYNKHSCHIRAARLRSSLERSWLDQQHPSVALWIIFIAYMTSASTEHQEWFKIPLISALTQRDIPLVAGWETLKVHLKPFIWTDSVHENLGKHFYNALHDSYPTGPSPVNSVCLSCGGINQGFQHHNLAPRNIYNTPAR